MPGSPALPGERNNRLTLISLHQKRRGGYRWLARCDCGNETIVVVRDFRRGHTKSCGCFHRERATATHVTHGRSEAPEYRVWSGMFDRCHNPNSKKYSYYGGRGISVCQRWEKFENFFADMGPRPSPGHSLHRIDNDGNYEPVNCRWADRFEQAQNKSNCVYVLLRGKKLSISEAERRVRLGHGSISQRVRRNGETHQQALDHFIHQHRLRLRA